MEVIAMATYVVTGDHYRTIDRRMMEIKRQLNQEGNSPLDPEVIAKGLQYLLEGGTLETVFEHSCSERYTPIHEAREILGKNFHGFDALQKYFGIQLTPQERMEMFGDVPFSYETLKACASTHVLVACGELSLLNIWQAKGDLFYSPTFPWFSLPSEPFSKIINNAGWQLVYKFPALDSIAKTWDEQNALVQVDEKVCSASVLAQAILIHFLETNELLFEHTLVRCTDTDSANARVHLGCFDINGLYVGREYDDTPHLENVGLAICKKPS